VLSSLDIVQIGLAAVSLPLHPPAFHNTPSFTAAVLLTVLHELTHAIQYDALSTSPVWLTESIADYLRLQAHLDPPHWRKAGVGRKEKGWEEGYDAGARFLAWLSGYGEDIASVRGDEGGLASENGRPVTLAMGGSSEIVQQPTSTSTQAARPQESKYPTHEYDPSQTKPNPSPLTKPRTGPFLDIVPFLNAKMEYEEYSESWWMEITGKNLEGLWEEYLQYYS
jgi:hypothetical protein